MPKIFTTLDKIKPAYDITYKVVLFICKLLLIADILITTMSVIGRYVSFIPDPAWSEEVVLTCMSYMAVLSAAPVSYTHLLGGVLYCDRETVDKIEKMKVCTCLNPLHTAMSIYGCMLGYTLISAEMADEDLRSFIQKIGYIEAMPVVVDPGVLNPYEFIGAVINRRLPNPFMPDAPQRIATDTSQKLAIRFGETIKAYQARGLDKSNLVPVSYTHLDVYKRQTLASPPPKVNSRLLA